MKRYPRPDPRNLYLRDHVEILRHSLRRLTGRDLVNRGATGAEAARLRGAPANSTASSSASTAERVVIDMTTYAALVPAAARETASAPIRGESR